MDVFFTVCGSDKKINALYNNTTWNAIPRSTMAVAIRSACLHPPKVFRSIPLDINPSHDIEDATTGISAPACGQPPWFCDLLFLASAKESSNDIFAIGIDDAQQDRHLFCTSMSVAVKQRIFLGDEQHDDDDGLALHHQRDFAMMRRKQNKAVGAFLHNLSKTVTGGQRLKAYMMIDDTEEEEEGGGCPSDESVLTLFLHFSIDSILTPAALCAGLITPYEEIEHISLRFEFSRTARAEHVASLALMMAAHGRLGKESALGRLLGVDLLHLICDAYRLRLYECRRCVWNE